VIHLIYLIAFLRFQHFNAASGGRALTKKP